MLPLTPRLPADINVYIKEMTVGYESWKEGQGERKEDSVKMTIDGEVMWTG